MKKIVFISFSLMLLATACKQDEVDPQTCATTATVKDYTGQDGCGFVFALEDGRLLEPYRIGFCGTPPLPKEVTEDPLYNFQFVDGKRVKMSYEAVSDVAGICMTGQVVKVTCLTEIVSEEK